MSGRLRYARNSRASGFVLRGADDDGRLLDRRVRGRGNLDVRAAGAQRRAERERERDDADVGVARSPRAAPSARCSRRGPACSAPRRTAFSCRSAASAARPYGANFGLAIAMRVTRASRQHRQAARRRRCRNPSASTARCGRWRTRYRLDAVGVAAGARAARDSRCRRRGRRRTARRSGSARRSCRTTRTTRSPWRWRRARTARPARQRRLQIRRGGDGERSRRSGLGRRRRLVDGRDEDARSAARRPGIIVSRLGIRYKSITVDLNHG